MKTRAFAILPVIAIVAGVGILGTWLLKPSILPGTESHRAAVSAKTTAALVSADTARAAAAAASVTKIAEANGTAPESPAKSFISQESTVALSHLPSPDPQALIEAEKRRAAVFAGERDEARRLYAQAEAKAGQLAKDRDRALAAKQASDTALVSAAAAAHAASLQRIGFGLVAVLAFGLWIYAKVYGITPATIGQVAADIRSGVSPIQALDTNLAPWLHKSVSTAAAVALGRQAIATPPPPSA